VSVLTLGPEGDAVVRHAGDSIIPDGIDFVLEPTIVLSQDVKFLTILLSKTNQSISVRSEIKIAKPDFTALASEDICIPDTDVSLLPDFCASNYPANAEESPEGVLLCFCSRHCCLLQRLMMITPEREPNVTFLRDDMLGYSMGDPSLTVVS
jgi:hypothetical protein